MESARGSIESSKMLSFAYCTCPSPPPISLPPFPKIFLFLCIKQDFPTSRLATIPPPPSLSPLKEMSQMKIKRNSLSPSLHTKSVQFPRSIFRNRKIVRPFFISPWKNTHFFCLRNVSTNFKADIFYLGNPEIMSVPVFLNVSDETNITFSPPPPSTAFINILVKALSIFKIGPSYIAQWNHRTNTIGLANAWRQGSTYFPKARLFGNYKQIIIINWNLFFFFDFIVA